MFVYFVFATTLFVIIVCYENASLSPRIVTAEYNPDKARKNSVDSFSEQDNIYKDLYNPDNSLNKRGKS